MQPLKLENFHTGMPNSNIMYLTCVRITSLHNSPYSKFKVGASIRMADGSIVSGCNVENAAYSPSICAERTAACKAISTGYSEFKAVAVVAFQPDSFTTPCGVCRQVLSEFAKDDIPVYVAKPSPCDQVLVTSIKSLLPYSFVPLPTD